MILGYGFPIKFQVKLNRTCRKQKGRLDNLSFVWFSQITWNDNPQSLV